MTTTSAPGARACRPSVPRVDLGPDESVDELRAAIAEDEEAAMVFVE